MSRSQYSVHRTFALGIALILLASALPAQAQESAYVFELFGGTYSPDTDVVDDDWTYGVRGGIQIAKPCGIMLSLGQAKLPVPDVPIEVDLTTVDLSVLWTPNPGNRAEFFLLGGVGWGFFEADVGSESFSDDSFTLNGGLSVIFHPSQKRKVYLRPEVKARWFDERDGEVDWEATLALGFFFPRG